MSTFERTSLSAIARACPAGATCAEASESGWGPWSNVAGPGGNTFTVGAAPVIITITGMNGANSYSPVSVTLSAGQSVAWRNADSVEHTATADGGAFDTGTIAPGETSAPITLGTAGTFGYHCTFHPTMTGTLTRQ